MTILDGLKSLSDYPVKAAKLQSIAALRGLVLENELDTEIMKGKAYQLATADVYMYISLAPDIEQGGVSISFTDAQRNEFKGIANDIYETQGEKMQGIVFGYKGDTL